MPLFVGLSIITSSAIIQEKQLSHHRKQRLIRQTTDATCGPAALASLLKFYFNHETSELEIAEISGTFEKRTTTLLGLRNACRAKGFSMTLPQLLAQIESSQIPVLIHFKNPSLHYALVCGRVENWILVSDPSQGNLSMDIADFTRRWDGYALVVSSSPTANLEIAPARKESATTRLQTLERSGANMAAMRF